MYKLHGLKGTQRIVFEDLARLLLSGEQVSVMRLADESGYTCNAVHSALKQLKNAGLIEMCCSTNGARAEYKITGGDVLTLQDLLRALINAMTMGTDERVKRLTMAHVAQSNYALGKRLKRLAAEIGGDFEANVVEFLSAHEVLKFQKVWPLDEANEIHAKIQAMITIAEEILDDGHESDAVV